MIFVLTTVFATGCEGPVEAKKRAANVVRELAISKGAPMYAPAEFKKAMTAWDKAEALMRENKISEARLAYREAKDGFEDAMWAVDAGKKAAATAVPAISHPQQPAKN